MFLQVLNKNRNQSHCRAFVDLLSEERLDVNKEYEEKTILQIVVEAGRFDFAKEVLRVPSCDPNIPNKISKKVALHLAVEKGNLELTKLLLDCGADINAKMQNGNTAIHIAAQRSAANWANSEERYKMILNMKEIWRGCEAQLHLQSLTPALVVPSLKIRGIKRIQVMNIRNSRSLRDLSDLYRLFGL